MLNLIVVLLLLLNNNLVDVFNQKANTLKTMLNTKIQKKDTKSLKTKLSKLVINNN